MGFCWLFPWFSAWFSAQKESFQLPIFWDSEVLLQLLVPKLMRLGHCQTTGDPAMPKSEPKPAERIFANSIGSLEHCSLRRFRENSQFQPEHLRTKK